MRKIIRAIPCAIGDFYIRKSKMTDSAACPKFSDLAFADYAYSRDYALTIVGEPVRGLFRRFSNLILGRGWKPNQIITHTSAGKIATAILMNGYVCNV
jgi:hypothetical protein